MTSHVARLYAAAGALLAFFLAWAGIAAHPWSAAPASATGARSQAVAAYETRLQQDAVLLRQLASRRATAAAPRVRIVNLPPLTVTRTS